MKTFVEEEIKTYTRQWEQAKKYHGYLGNIKLILVLLFLYLLYSASRSGQYTLWLWVVFAGVAGVWYLHRRYAGKKNYCGQMIQIYQDYICRMDGTWSSFKNTGGKWIAPDHPYGHDLDVVGQGSLFQWLNTAVTGFGERAFAEDLLHLNYSEEDIRQRAAAMEELAGDMPFKTRFQYYGKDCGGDEEIQGFIQTLADTKPYFQNQWLRLFFYYLPMATIPVMIFTAVFLKSYLYIAYYIVLLHGIIWLLTAFRAYRFTKPLEEVYVSLYGYDRLFSLVQQKQAASPLLKRLQKDIGEETAPAMKKLKQLGQKAHMKNNILLYIFLNLFLLWDHSLAVELDAWKKKYAAAMAGWFETLGQWESIMCFSNLENVLAHHCRAEVGANIKGIVAQDTGHPFITEEKRVYNDVSFDNEIVIVSGSNMSGKTTFLRTVGVNMVLAMNGSHVCAGFFKAQPYTLATSMRIADSLQEGVSTFYQELKKIRRILDLAEQKGSCLFLIDEIFRGTNSTDRLKGAEGVLLRLHACHTGGFITTHDLALCKLEAVAGIKNMHFEESYSQKEIHFDYKIKEGPTVSSNGRFLMEMLEIL